MSLLAEEVGGIVPPGGGDQAAGSEDDAALLRDELRRASRKALTMVVACWGAVAVLLLTREAGVPFLPFTGIDRVFSLGVLLVAVYSGFRLGQWEKLRTVTRLVEELADRQEG